MAEKGGFIALNSPHFSRRCTGGAEVNEGSSRNSNKSILYWPILPEKSFTSFIHLAMRMLAYQ